MNGTKIGRLFLPGIIALVGYEWVMAGFEKLETHGGFASGMARTLTAFASKNPNGWYKGRGRIRPRPL